MNFVRAEDSARFLFDKEIMDFLRALRDDLSKLDIYREKAAGDLDETQRNIRIDKGSDCFERIATFESKFEKLVAPYMKMSQKFSWPRWWYYLASMKLCFQ